MTSLYEPLNGVEGPLYRIGANNRFQINCAGPRYTPGVDPDAPNIYVQNLQETLDGLSFHSSLRLRLKEIEEEFKKLFEEEERSISLIYGDSKNESPIMLQELMISLQSKSPNEESSLKELTANLKNLNIKIIQRLQAFRDQLQDKQIKIESEHSKEKDEIEYKLRSVRKIENVLLNLREFIRSSAFRALTENALLILGQWGTGKTHFLCDVTRKGMLSNLPIMFVLGHRLPRLENNLDEFVIKNQLAGDFFSLLKKMNQHGQEQRCRSLIIIDAINEADRLCIIKSIQKIFEIIHLFPNVGIVLSCRTPFEQQLISSSLLKDLNKVTHVGFADNENLAQKEFFKFYQIPLPEVPLLSNEFSRPLFLKILCESLKDMSTTKMAKQFGDIASGQVGFTFVLENFIKKIGLTVENKLNLPIGYCWRLIKERDGFAGHMAEKLQPFLFQDEAAQILKKHLPIPLEPKMVLDEFIHEGILVSDSIWQNDKYVEILRFPYERFSDHIISRHLLTKEFIDYSNSKSIKKSFLPDSHIGRIFKLTKWGNSFEMPGLAEALMLEFPTRVQRFVRKDKCELLFYLPKETLKLTTFNDIFLNGLYWRRKSAFCKQTFRIINFLLSPENPETAQKTLDTLVSLATKNNHPCSAETLVRYLTKKTVSERDYFWSEYLRDRYSSTTIRRILDWVFQSETANINDVARENLIQILSMCLTSTDRGLRDEVTKALVELGKNHLSLIFRHTLTLLTFNDSYVVERMLAVSYGCLLKRAVNISKEEKKHISKFSRGLMKKMVGESAHPKFKHALMREYFEGIVEFSIYFKCIRLNSNEKKKLLNPFKNSPSPFPRMVKESSSNVILGQKAFMIDFENYTIGTLINNRRNYDNEHGYYQKVKRRIAWRVADIGFNDKLDALDRSIRDRSYSRQNDSDKVERYGKKYSWIAFFEMHGHLSDIGYLKKDKWHPRLSKVDIDPSFPAIPGTIDLDFPNFPSLEIDSAIDWLGNGENPNYKSFLEVAEIDGISGPWICLDGYVSQKFEKDGREVFSFINGLFVSPQRRDQLIERFLGIEYPGNRELPEEPEDHYTFAGEIPWSSQFSFGYPKKSGCVVPYKEKILPLEEKVIRKTPVKKAWYKLMDRLGEKQMPSNPGFSYGLSEASEDEISREAFNSTLKEINAELKPEGLSILDLLHYKPTAEDLERGYRIEEVVLKKDAIEVEVPIHGYSWESYHSKFNDSGSATVPSLPLCKFLKLLKRDGAFDFVDEKGDLGASYRKRLIGNNKFHGLYIRRDLLNKYLTKNSQDMVFLIWGERRLDYKFTEKNRELISEAWEWPDKIHKSAFSLNISGVLAHV